MLLTLLWLLAVICQPIAASASDGTLTIAVASNFKTTLEDLVTEFAAKTDTRIRISSASTGILYAQIKSGAPFDLFLAADVLRPKLLVEDHYAVAATRFTYALGQLVLWAPGHTKVNQSLLTGSNGRISMANPEIAPYGLAARQYLQSINVWKDLKFRFVYGANVAQAFQHLVSGNAPLGLTALSLLVDYRRSPESTAAALDYWTVPDHLYDPIEQQGVLLTRSTHPNLANEFIDFMKSATGRKIISKNGYLLPSRMDRP
jgi:molybdate transport system substrate-binding protein